MNMYDGLVRYKDGTLEVEPALAESWDISVDGTVYTFNLRSGVTFHDGTAVDADAVKFNFDRMLDESPLTMIQVRSRSASSFRPSRA